MLDHAIEVLGVHPYHVATVGYGVASAELIATVTPSSFGAWAQSVNVAVMAIGSTLIVLWQRRETAKTKAREEAAAARHEIELAEANAALLSCPLAIGGVAKCRISDTGKKGNEAATNPSPSVPEHADVPSQ